MSNDFDAKSWAFVTASIRLVSEANKMLAKNGPSDELNILTRAIGLLCDARSLIHTRISHD